MVPELVEGHLNISTQLVPELVEGHLNISTHLVPELVEGTSASKNKCTKSL